MQRWRVGRTEVCSSVARHEDAKHEPLAQSSVEVIALLLLWLLIVCAVGKLVIVISFT